MFCPLLQINQEGRNKAIRELVKWIDNNPNSIDAKNIPSMCLAILGKIDAESMLNNTTFARLDNFRNSLRRFSTISNKIAPVQHLIPPTKNSPRRSVTFNDVPTVYCITK